MTQAESWQVLALDRATARSYNVFGHLRVTDTNISKAGVNPYLGREIPNADQLGLDSGRIYYLLRDPQELEQSAASFNGSPLLHTHKPLHAQAHDHALTVGTVSETRWEPPYLKATLNVWDDKVIQNISNGSQKEVSSAYGYWADMTPGSFEGVRYDGIMRGLHANHVALVRKGRAGPDVVVGDSMENILMAKNALTRAAAHTQGALSVFLMSKLAQDASIDLAPVVDGLTAENFKDRKPHVALAVKNAAHGKLAQDASLDDLDGLLNGMEKVLPAEPTPDKPADTAETVSKVAMDEAVAQAQRDTEARVRQELASDKPDLSAMVSKVAMDQAIKTAVAEARRDAAADATKTQQAIREAERTVRPWVGDLAVACDSAEAVHRTALGMLGVKHDGLHPDALLPILQAQAKPSDKPKAETARVAMDAAASKSFNERFGTDRIGHA